MLDKVTGKEQGIVFDLERGYRDGGRHVAMGNSVPFKGGQKTKERSDLLVNEEDSLLLSWLP